jgi:hypothetical protein
MSEDKIIRLGELIEHRLRKEKEIEFYKQQLLELQDKIFNLQKDVDLTKLIIDIVQSEKVIDKQQKVEEAIPVIGVDNGTPRSK